MAVRRNPSGPLRFSNLVNFVADNGAVVQFFAKTTPPDVEPQEDDQDHIIRLRERSDAVSSRELGTSKAAHLIMLRNETDAEPMRLWPNDWYPGRRVQIPTRDSLRDRNLL